MKQSLRAKRMDRHHKRNKQQTKLSLVSLMDIFTILVFFLMLNASDVQVLQNDKTVTLPESSAETAAKETLLLLVNAKDIMLQGKPLATVDDALQNSADVIEALAAELTYQKSRKQPVEDEEFSGAITIMADQAMPYQLLKKLMQTCAENGYTDIALAVEHKEGKSSQAEEGV